LLDQGHELPPYQLVARQIGRRDGRRTSVFLRDYSQVWLVALPGDGLAAGEPQPIGGSDGHVHAPVQVGRDAGTRYDVAGDSFDYALNGDAPHVAMVDAMGHGLDAAAMATVVIGAYRHARRTSSACRRSTRSWTGPSPSSSAPTTSRPLR
jgi:hypothetical protein